MRHRVSIGLGLACVLLGSGRAAAQQPRTFVYLGAGALASLAKLNSSGTASLRGGPYIGGGVNWQVVPGDSSFVLQGDVTLTREELRTNQTGSGTKVNLTFVGANLEYIYIQTRRFEFTVSGGGGVVFVYVVDTTGAIRARPFARLGLSARYVFRPSLQAFVQGFGTMYDLQNFPSSSVLGPYTRRQSPVGIGAGLALGL